MEHWSPAIPMHTVFMEDVDRDGIRDCFVSCRREWGPSSVMALSGTTPRMLWEMHCPEHLWHMSCNFGQKHVELPDVDGDSFIDFVFSDTSGYPNAGREEPSGIWAVSGATGHVLRERVEREWPAPHSISGYGWSLLSPADIDGDGIKDVVVGTWSNGDFDVLDALSAKTGRLLWRVEPCDPVLQLNTVGDCNGDGLPDIAVVRWPDSEGRLRNSCVYSSADGSLLFLMPGSEFSR
jgi:hypothetical protein